MNFLQNLRKQRGAMFGLDARLALIIFAVLSVVAGIAIVDSIKKTRISALTTEFDNMAKGYIGFTLDTGVDVPLTGTNGGFQNLYKDANATLGWNGPYITLPNSIQNIYGGQYDIFHNWVTKTWSTIPAANADSCTGGTTSDVCGVWLRLTIVPCEIAQALDKAIDYTAAGDDGNFRYDDTCAAGSKITVAYMMNRVMQ